MQKVLLSIPHKLQEGDGDCLAACVAMVLAHLGQEVDYTHLLSLPAIEPYGAPAGNVRLLANLNLNVTYSQTDLAGLEALLRQGHSVIVFARTGELPYWTHDTDHALVVIGCDQSQMYVADPNCSEAPIAVPRGDFELAWLERDYYYAVIATENE